MAETISRLALHAIPKRKFVAYRKHCVTHVWCWDCDDEDGPKKLLALWLARARDKHDWFTYWDLKKCGEKLVRVVKGKT